MLRLESDEGVLKLRVDMKGILNMYDHITVKCKDVMVNIVSSSSSPTKFRRKKCNVERHGDL